MAIDPLHELRHGPVVEQRRPAVVAPIALDARARFTDLLPVEQQDGPRTIKVLQGAKLVAGLRRAEAGAPRPALGHDRRGDAALVVVFEILYAVVARGGGQQGHLAIVVVQAALPLVNALQAVVGTIVVHGVKAGVDQGLLPVRDRVAAVRKGVRLGEEILAAASRCRAWRIR